MTIDRRGFLYAGGMTAAAAPFAAAAQAAPAPGGRSVTELGVEPNADRDQTETLQKAIDELTQAGQPVLLPAGTFGIRSLKLPKSCTIIGTPGLTVLRGMPGDSSKPMLSGGGVGMFHLSGVAFEGRLGNAGAALLSVADAAVNINHCRFSGASALCVVLDNCSGIVEASEIAGPTNIGIHARRAAGLAVIGCRITTCAVIGIYVSGAEGGEREYRGFTVSQNNLSGCSIAADGDGIVTGNIVNRTMNRFGLKLGVAKGNGHILAQGNLIRDCLVGIGVSSSGDDIMASLNMISGAKDGAIRAFDGDKLVGPDLARQSAEAYLNLMVAGNVVR